MDTKALRDKVFDRLFEESEIARFTKQELHEYEDSKKAYRDIKNSIDTAKRDGIAEGIEIGKSLGKAEGIELGKAEGMELGKAEGIELGKAEGMELGKAEGIELGKAEGMELGKAEGIELGISEGEKRKARTIAKTMLGEKIPLSLISKITGLSEVEIEDIQK